jgi:DNA-directed RNA polymerase subunit RPC12/RpoP
MTTENKNYYKCPFCTKEIKSLGGLKSHIKKAHLLYGIYCPYCIEIYGTIGKLVSHLATQNDEYHRNLYFLISGRYLGKVNKKILTN